MAFHTNDLICPLNFSEYSLIKNNLIRAASAVGENATRTDNNGQKYHFFNWVDIGIKAYLHNYEKYNYQYLRIIFNCSKLLKHGEHLTLPEPTEDMGKQLKAALISGLKETGLLTETYIDSNGLYDSDEECLVEVGSIQRIDACINWNVGSIEAVRAYISVLNRGYRPDYQLPPKAQGKPFEKSAAFRKSGRINKTTHLNIGYNLYDKNWEQQQLTKYPLSAEELERSKGILRLEIQIGKKHFQTTRLSNHFDDIVTVGVSRYFLQTYLEQLVWSTGDYYKYEEAKAIIERHTRHNKQKDKRRTMLKILKAISAEAVGDNDISLDKVLGELGITRNKRSKYKTYFDELGVNPVTLPAEYKIKKLENPLKQLDNLYNGIVATAPPKRNGKDIAIPTDIQEVFDREEEATANVIEDVEDPISTQESLVSINHSLRISLKDANAQIEALRAENQKLREELEALKATAAQPELPKKSELQHTEDGFPVRQLMANGLYRMIDDPSEEFDFDGAPLDAQTVQPTGIGLLTIREINKRINAGFYDEYYREHPDEDPRIPHDPEDEDDEDDVPF